MKVFLVNVRVDWHNSDADDFTVVYENEEDAKKRFQKEIKNFKNLCKREEKEIEYERTEGNWCGIANECEDYFNVNLLPSTVVKHKTTF